MNQGQREERQKSAKKSVLSWHLCKSPVRLFICDSCAGVWGCVYECCVCLCDCDYVFVCVCVGMWNCFPSATTSKRQRATTTRVPHFVIFSSWRCAFYLQNFFIYYYIFNLFFTFVAKILFFFVWQQVTMEMHISNKYIRV